MRIMRILLLVLLVSSPLSAQRGDLPVDVEEDVQEDVQEKEERLPEPEGFFFTPSRIGAGRDTGFLVGEVEASDRVLDLMPAGVGFLNLTPRSEFFFAYEPEFEFFDEHDSLNSWNHSVGLRLDYDATRRWRFSAGGSFISTEDLTRRLGSLIVVPRGDARHSVAFLRFSCDLSRATTLDFGLENSTSKTPLPGQALPFLDQMVNAGRVSLTRFFGRDHSLGALYSYTKPGTCSKKSIFTPPFSRIPCIWPNWPTPTSVATFCSASLEASPTVTSRSAMTSPTCSPGTFKNGLA